MSPHVIRTTHRRFRDRRRARRNHIAHLRVDDPGDDELVQLRLVHVGITRQNRFVTPAPDRDFFQLLGFQNVEIDCVIQVVTVISDFIREIGDLRFERRAFVFRLARDRRIVELVVLSQSFPHFERQVQSRKRRIRRLEQLDNALALFVVIEPAVIAHAFVEHLFAGMPERRMPEVMRQRDRLGQIFI